jgi:hypothetical protein
VGELLLVLSEDGQLFLVEASPKEANRVLGQVRVIEDESKVWNNLALYERYLLVRNAHEAACYELPLGTPPRDASQRGVNPAVIPAKPRTPPSSSLRVE